jgi:hypothetical protein
LILRDDEPGQLLVLEDDLGEKAAHNAVIVVVLGIILGLPTAYCLYAVLSGLASGKLQQAFMASLMLAFVLVILRLAYPGMMASIMCLRRLKVDRTAGELEIVHVNVLTGKPRTMRTPLPRLQGANVRMVPRREATSPGVTLVLRFDERTATPRQKTLDLAEVVGVDRREEVADLAYRFGAAAGLSHQRVVRNDGREIEIELASSPGPGLEPLTVPETCANYARNQVSAAATAAAATERLPPFDPAKFSHDRCVPVWAPGREVRFEMGPSPLGRTTTFDWATRTITRRHLMSETRIGFGEVEAVEARVVHVTHRTPDQDGDSGTMGRESVTVIYHGEVYLHLRDGSRPDSSVFPIVSSGNFANPDGPYHQTLPLVTELATALGVERRITDYK